MRDRFKMIASSYLLLIRDGKILLSRRYKTGYEDGKYSLPAWHIEKNETSTEGGMREDGYFKSDDRDKSPSLIGIISIGPSDIFFVPPYKQYAFASG